MEAGTLDVSELSDAMQFMLGKKDIIPFSILANTDGAKSIEARKRGFMSLYVSEWQALGMNSKLKKLTAERKSRGRSRVPFGGIDWGFWLFRTEIEPHIKKTIHNSRK